MIATFGCFLLTLVSAVSQSPEMQKLSFLIGEWHSVERSTAPNREPIDFTLDGKNEWTLGGKGIKIEETLHFPGDRKSYNFILTLWDAKQEKYVMHWYSDNASGARTFAGTFVGNRLVLVHTPDAGQGLTMRITYVPESERVISALLEVKVEDEWQVRTVAKYTRKQAMKLFNESSQPLGL